jgi:hypothetical protein
MKRFFKKIVLFLTSLFSNVNNWIYDHVQPSIETVQRLKLLFDSPAADALAALIPGDADKKAILWVRKNLDKAIEKLIDVPSIINEPDPAKKIMLLVAWLKKLSPSMQKGALLRLASEMAIASGGKKEVKGHAVDLLTQMQYSKLIENVSHEDLAPNYCKNCGNPQQ